MPRYFFHIRDNGTLVEDPDGIELPDMADVQDECRRLILSVLQEEEPTEDFLANREFLVADELGRAILTVPFRAAVLSLRVCGK